jgi:hypothetical protein
MTFLRPRVGPQPTLYSRPAVHWKIGRPWAESREYFKSTGLYSTLDFIWCLNHQNMNFFCIWVKSNICNYGIKSVCIRLDFLCWSRIWCQICNLLLSKWENFDSFFSHNVNEKLRFAKFVHFESSKSQISDIRFVISIKNRFEDIPTLLILMNLKFDSFFMQKSGIFKLPPNNKFSSNFHNIFFKAKLQKIFLMQLISFKLDEQ